MVCEWVACVVSWVQHLVSCHRTGVINLTSGRLAFYLKKNVSFTRQFVPSLAAIQVSAESVFMCRKRTRE